MTFWHWQNQSAIHFAMFKGLALNIKNTKPKTERTERIETKREKKRISNKIPRILVLLLYFVCICFYIYRDDDTPQNSEGGKGQKKNQTKRLRSEFSFRSMIQRYR